MSAQPRRRIGLGLLIAVVVVAIGVLRLSTLQAPQPGKASSTLRVEVPEEQPDLLASNEGGQAATSRAPQGSAPLDDPEQYVPTVFIRSQAGLPLEGALVCRDLQVGEWIALGLEQVATLELPAEQHERWIKTVGHLAAHLPIGPGEVELEVDALFEIIGPGGADPGWTSWDVGDWRRQWMAGLYVVGVVDGSWRLAVDAERFSSHRLLSNPLGFSIQLGSPWQLEVNWEVVPHDRTLVELPPSCAPARPRSSVVVSVAESAHGAVTQERTQERTQEETQEVTWALHGFHGYSLGAGTMPRSHFQAPIRGAWGVIQIRANNRLWREEAEQVGGPRKRFDDLFLNETYVVTAHWNGRRQMGRRVFVHDGEPIVLESVRGGVCRLQLVDAETGLPLPESIASIGTYYGDENSSSYLRSWHSFTRLSVSASGRLEFPLYGELPSVPLAPFPPGIAPKVVINVPGFKAWTSEGSLGVAGADGVIDLGAIALERTGHWLALHSKQLERWKAENYIYIGTLLDGQQVAVETFQVKRSDSALLWVDPSDEEALAMLRKIQEAASVKELLVDGASDFAEAFVRDIDGTWRARPEVNYQVTLRYESEEDLPAAFVAAWTWQGIQAYPMGLQFDLQTKVQTLSFRAPREGVQLSVQDQASKQVQLHPLQPGNTEIGL